MSDWRVPGFAEVQELGAGAQGRAVLVRDLVSGNIAVLKYVFAAADPGARIRFRQESALLKQVSDAHVARWYGHFEGPAGSAILMEAIDGVTLREILREQGVLEAEMSLLVLKGSLLGLAAAHSAGVVHRDYKPGNVMVAPDGQSKLIDFGIAGLAGEGTRAGTPAYMAPEQWRGDPSTPATDVYAATCVFFECVTGRRPYLADDLVMLMSQHLTAPIPYQLVPEPLHPLIASGIAKDAADRPATAADFVTELEAVARRAYGPDWEERAVRRLAEAAAALAVLFPVSAAMSSGAASGTAAGTAAVTGKATFVSTVVGKAVATGVAVAVTASAAAGVYAATRRTGHHPRPTVASAPAVPLLGQVWGSGQFGFGAARPSAFFAGGDPTSYVHHIHWLSWGGATALGDGIALYVTTTVAASPQEPARVIAYNLGPCRGKLAYRSVRWYFPQHGQTAADKYGGFDDICAPFASQTP